MDRCVIEDVQEMKEDEEEERTSCVLEEGSDEEDKEFAEELSAKLETPDYLAIHVGRQHGQTIAGTDQADRLTHLSCAVLDKSPRHHFG